MGNWGGNVSHFGLLCKLSWKWDAAVFHLNPLFSCSVKSWLLFINTMWSAGVLRHYFHACGMFLKPLVCLAIWILFSRLHHFNCNCLWLLSSGVHRLLWRSKLIAPGSGCYCLCLWGLWRKKWDPWMWECFCLSMAYFLKYCFLCLGFTLRLLSLAEY